MGAAWRPYLRGRDALGATAIDLRILLRQGASLVLALALVLLVLPSFATVAHAASQRLYLHNYPTPPSGNTPAGRALPMDGSAPTAATLYQYSTDHFQGRSGRYVHEGSTNSAEGNLLYMTNWVYQVPQNTVLSGNAVGGIWIGQKDGCNLPGRFHLFLRAKSSAITDAGTLLASGAGTIPAVGASPPCGFGLAGVTLPVNTTVPAGTWLELKLTVSDGDRDAGMVAYDTTSYASYLDLPVGTPSPTPQPPTPTPTPEPATPTPEPATPTPEPVTPTPEPATPTPEPATPTPEPATPTPEPPTPTPDPATPTPEPPTPTPTAPPPTPTPEPPTPVPPTPTPPPTWYPTDPPTPAPTPPPPPTPTPPPPTPTPTAPPPTPTVAPTETPGVFPTFLPPVRPHETMPPLGELETPPPPPPPSVPPESAPPTPRTATPPPAPGPLAPLATPAPRPLAGDDGTTRTGDGSGGEPSDDEEGPVRQLVDLTGGGPGDSGDPGDGGGSGSSFGASIAKLAKTAGEAVKTFAFPLSLTILVLIFLLIQGEIDRRDPKLAFAPVDSSKDMVYFE